MRELKFRAWDKKRKCYAERIQTLNTSCPYHDRMNMFKGVMTFAKWVLRRYILEQYTCLKDKNGREIYEGDIVRYAFEYPKGEWVEEVSFGKISDGEGYYHDYFLAWRTTDKDGDGHQSLLDLEGYCEVIGNIHENPELLEGKK